jgi:CRISPR/Cas system-associated exonuclease Cas4 (RecB family)
MMKFSPSQLSTWRMCRRKWFYASVLKLPQPETGSTVLGSRCHAFIEKWILREDVEMPADLAKILRSVVEDPFYLALRARNDVQVETMADSIFETFKMNGRVDCHWPDVDDPDHWFIMDHKTSKDPGKYAKSVGEAETDPQTICYAYDVLVKQKVSKVTIIYAYINTQKSVPVQFVYARHTRESLEALLPEMAYDLAGMHKVRENPHEDAVPRTTSACWQFGGCPFRERCFQSTSNPDESSTNAQQSSEKPVNILNLIKQNNVQPAAPAPTPAAAPAPTPDIPKVVQPAAVATAAPAPAPAPTPVVEAPAAVPAVEMPVAEAPVAEVPKRRGRPAGSKNLPKEGSTKDKEVEASGNPDSIVLVGAVLVGVACPTLEEWLEWETDLISRYESATRKNWLEDQYNAGPKLIAAELIASLKSGALQLPDFIFVSKTSLFAPYLGAFKGIPRVRLVMGV